MSNCNDPLACNFNPKSCFDEENGNCCYVTGCMDGAFGVNNDINGNDMNGVPCPYPCLNGFFWDNYDPEACCESKCCLHMGCTNPSSFNYDPAADCDDGSCCSVSGCTDSTTGLNPDIFGNGIDGTPCSWPCINVTGYTGYLVDNYNPDSCFSSSPCGYPVYGCMDSSALNYYSGATEPCNHVDFVCVYDISGNTQQIYDPTGLGYNISGCCCCYISGCTDPTACNYLSGACMDDGSCLGLFGCSDPTACNYNPLATCNDGSCILGTGCTDPSAVNYDPAACWDDGSCCYSGCTDPTAVNYSVIFCIEDGSCCYNGCTDPAACNYSVTACIDDGSCLTDWGCMDNWTPALNYDPIATCPDGSCCYVSGCTDPSAANYNSLACMSAPCCYASGCTDPIACNYLSGACTDDGSCCYACGCTDNPATSTIPNNDPFPYVITGFGVGPFNYDPLILLTCDDGSCCYIVGCMDPTAMNYTPGACLDDGSCITAVFGCTFSGACNYYAGANIDDGTCLSGGCADITACNYDPTATCPVPSLCCYVSGCTDPLACNYVSGSCCPTVCYYPGCTDPLACNYDPTACLDDGSCNDTYGCMNPLACDYEPLANCGTVCCFDCGCDDPLAYNYDALACFNDGSCCYDGGCMDPSYCNYDAFACFNTSVCCNTTGCTVSAEANYDATACCDCNGDWILSPSYTPQPGWSGCCCPSFGCTDPAAYNYDASAVCDDGSCISILLGCTWGVSWNGFSWQLPTYSDIVPGYTGLTYGEYFSYDPQIEVTQAFNYNSASNVDDGSCIWVGCTDPAAYNFFSAASIDNGSCVYCSVFGAIISATTCTSGGSGTTLCTGTIVATASGGSSSYTYQVFDSLGVLQNPLALCLGEYKVTVTDTAWGCVDSISGVTIGYAGCTFYTNTNYDPNATCDDGSCIPCGYGCMDDGCCTDGTLNLVGSPCPNGSGPGTTWHLCPTVSGPCWAPPGPSYNSPFLLFLSGVTTYNYNATKTIDAGICIYYNCLDTTSGNYNFASPSPFDCIGGMPVFPAFGDTRCCCYGTTPMPPHDPCCLSGNTSVPDVIFENFIESQVWYTCATSPVGEVVNDCICPITYFDPNSLSISSLVGIEGFVNLEQLYCSDNLLTNLDVSNNTALTILNCSTNGLTGLSVSNNTDLTSLRCELNNLTSVDVSANTALFQLYCYSNQLTSIDVSTNIALGRLKCSDNQLTSLIVSANTALGLLHCDDNQLTSLDVSANPALYYLVCSNNPITSLDVSANTAIKFLYCNFNQLTSIDGLSNKTALLYVYCAGNQLTSLDVSTNTSLMQVSCDQNQITSINLGSTIDLNTFSLQAMNNAPGMVVHVGTAGRVTTANLVFTAGVNFDVGTIIAI